MQPMEEGSKGMFCCGKARCKVCKFVETGSMFVGNVEKRSFHINHTFDCDSQGVVYLIEQSSGYYEMITSHNTLRMVLK